MMAWQEQLIGTKVLYCSYMNLLTIVIPSKNQGNYIKETLENLKNQTFKNFEVIIIDAFSIDQTLKIVDEYKSKIQIKFIQKEFDADQATVYGMSLVKTKYIALSTTSDFYPFNDWLRLAIEKLEYDKELSCVWSNAINIDENSKFTGIWKPEYFIKNPPDKKNYLYFWLFNHYLPELNFIVDTNIFKKCVNLNLETLKITSINYSYKFYLNFTKKGYLQEYINYIGHAGRTHGNSITIIDHGYEKRNKSWIYKEKIKYILKVFFGFKKHVFRDRNSNEIYRLNFFDRLVIPYKIIKTIIKNFKIVRLF